MADEYLELNGVALNIAGAWRAASLAPLLDDSPLHGTNLFLPGATGRRARLRRRDESVRTIPLHVFGINNVSGTPYADRKLGLVINAEYLKANIGTASTATGSLVTATWHRTDGSTKTAQVQVGPLNGFVKQAPYWATTTFDLVIPLGVFA